MFNCVINTVKVTRKSLVFRITLDQAPGRKYVCCMVIIPYFVATLVLRTLGAVKLISGCSYRAVQDLQLL